jgi:hypothetical protein
VPAGVCRGSPFIRHCGRLRPWAAMGTREEDGLRSPRGGRGSAGRPAWARPPRAQGSFMTHTRPTQLAKPPDEEADLWSMSFGWSRQSESLTGVGKVTVDGGSSVNATSRVGAASGLLHRSRHGRTHRQRPACS